MSKKKKTLLLFTISFPYLKASEDTFLSEEINYLKDKFDDFIIVPKTIGGNRVNPNVKIDETLAKVLKRKSPKIKKIINGLNLKLILHELKSKALTITDIKNVLKLVLYIHEMKKIEAWFNNSRYYNLSDVLIYTYWFTGVTSFFATIKNENIKVITRVHGADLYEERNDNYIPLRKYTIKKLDYIYSVSKAGKEYLSNKYPEFKYKYKVAHLGVKRFDRTIKTKKDDKVFRIVSCSSIIPLKQVDLILKGIIKFTKLIMDGFVEYIHFGDGPQRETVWNIYENKRVHNLRFLLKGYVENKKILEFYNKNYIDVFVNASTTEGVPVSLMEAQSFGIPCIGTNVGGIPEIIQEGKTGYLLSANTNETEIAEKLLKIYRMSSNEIIDLRKNSYNNWEKNFNAQINFERFTEELLNL